MRITFAISKTKLSNSQRQESMKSIKVRPAYRQLTSGIALLFSITSVVAAPESILFVGNSYTFGRVDPVMSYNAANVRDLTAAMQAANASGSNAFEPRPWGGVAGIFKQFTVQSGLDYDVAMPTPQAGICSAISPPKLGVKWFFKSKAMNRCLNNPA
jgi:hypothetical protein